VLEVEVDVVVVVVELVLKNFVVVGCGVVDAVVVGGGGVVKGVVFGVVVVVVVVEDELGEVITNTGESFLPSPGRLIRGFFLMTT